MNSKMMYTLDWFKYGGQLSIVNHEKQFDKKDE